VIPFGALKPETPGALVEQQNRRERRAGSGRRYRLEYVGPELGWRVWRMA
jgi:hypothetical protein